MGKHTVKNISTGIRGFNSADFGLLELAPGASTLEKVEISDAELAVASKTGWFEIDGKATEEAHFASGTGKAPPVAPAQVVGGPAPADEQTDDLANATGPQLDAIAAAEDIDLSTIEGTGSNGRVIVDDKRNAIRAARAAKAAGAGEAPTDELAGMDDATLLTTAAAILGKPEAELADKSRDELLALARGQ